MTTFVRLAVNRRKISPDKR